MFFILIYITIWYNISNKLSRVLYSGLLWLVFTHELRSQLGRIHYCLVFSGTIFSRWFRWLTQRIFQTADYADYADFNKLQILQIIQIEFLMRKRMNLHRLAGAKRHWLRRMQSISRESGNLIIYSEFTPHLLSTALAENDFLKTADFADFRRGFKTADFADCADFH